MECQRLLGRCHHNRSGPAEGATVHCQSAQAAPVPAARGLHSRGAHNLGCHTCPHTSHTPHTHLTYTLPTHLTYTPPTPLTHTHTSHTCPYLEVGLSCQEHAHPFCRGQEAHAGPLRLELTRQQAAQGLAVDVVAKEAVVEVVGVAGLGRHRQGHNLGREGQQCSGPQPLTTQPSLLTPHHTALTPHTSPLTTQPSHLTTQPSYLIPAKVPSLQTALN